MKRVPFAAQMAVLALIFAAAIAAILIELKYGGAAP
jgi:hypothetical protein